MKKYFAISLGLLLFLSCNENDVGKERMDKFITRYRDSFKESDLVLFHYNPRSKFEYFKDSVSYRINLRQDNMLSISIGKDRVYLDTNDKVQKFIHNYLNFVEQHKVSMDLHMFSSTDWLAKNEENDYILINDSNEIFKLSGITFDFEPILYFKHLEFLINDFGILSIESWKNEIKIIFDSKNSLIYFPNKPSVEDTLNMKYVRIDDYWYKNYNEINTDYR